MVNNYRLIVMLFIALFSYSSWSQVGINTTTPNNGSLLDVDARDKGILIPRINITDLSNIAPIAGLANALEISSAESLLVYNTNTGTGKGFHYWDGTTWIPLGDKNLGKDDLTQSEEPRTYDMNGEDLNFTNGAFGINTPNPNGAFEATSTENYNAYTFTQDNSLTGEKDVFTIEDQDNAGNGQDHSSVLKVFKNGTINNGASGYSLIELASTGGNPGDDKYWISGRTTDEGAPLWGVDIADNDYWSDGGITLGVTTNSNGTYSNGNFRVNSDGTTSINSISASPGAILDVNSSDKGVLITRVALTDADEYAPITPSTTTTEGLLVYNTNTNSPEPTDSSRDVTPGFYYWSGSKWKRLISEGFSIKYKQDDQIRANSNSNTYVTLPNLDQTFTAPITGLYQILVNAYYAVEQPIGFTEAPLRNSAGNPHLSNTHVRQNHNSAGHASIRLLQDTTVTLDEKYIASYGMSFPDGQQFWAHGQSMIIIVNVEMIAGQSYRFQVQGREWARFNSTTRGIFGWTTNSHVGNNGNSTAQYGDMTITLINQH